MKIHFYLRFHTQFGQSLHVVGNHPALGNDEVSGAVALEYLNTEFWKLTVEFIAEMPEALHYRYLLKNADGSSVLEWGRDRRISTTLFQGQDIRLLDTWNHAGEFENTFYTDPFQVVLLPKNRNRHTPHIQPGTTHLFKAKAPLLRKNEVLCLTGNGKALGEWSESAPILMSLDKGWWSAALELPVDQFPLSYKYGVYNVKSEKFIRFEDGANRVLLGDAVGSVTVIHDGFAHLPNNTWKGAGVAIPLFSLRSKDSFGVGEFTDLRLLVDWAVKTGLKVIQLLPVNDTTATHSWQDSYPYAAISAFALHPIFVNLEAIAGKKFHHLIEPLRKRQKELNGLPEVNYEEVMKLKLAILRELFELKKDTLQAEDSYTEFFERNRYWLVPYAAFCHLRDKNGTSDFSQWKSHTTYSRLTVEKYVSPRSKYFDEILFHYFIQYHLHLQLQDAAEYAHQQGIILKGDIPIGVYRYGCDAWMEPELFHMDMQAGAPPDDFAVHGQNWGFPTYNWERMANDGFQWWHRRFVQMGTYFDAFRIDHILGFFRIWSIPMAATQGIMGRFVPAIPVHIKDFGKRGIYFDHYRYCAPFITDAVLQEFFGTDRHHYDPFLRNLGNGFYELKEEFQTQRHIEAYFDAREEESERNSPVRKGLLDLAANIILFEEEGSQGTHYHFRFHMHRTASYRHLDEQSRKHLYDLYVEYFFRWQDDYWKQQALKKLPALKQATNMLICGEDLGLVPSCVPEVMQQLGILSLEIQRMPKDPHKTFFHPREAPYLSVVTPSTHDMSTVRGWWEEDRNQTQKFFNEELGQPGEAPHFCEPWINKAIVVQHLYAPAMWSIFQLQDLLGINGHLRRENPHEERINVPANPRHYWNYRMHLTLEQLLKEKEFNHELRDLVEASGRG